MLAALAIPLRAQPQDEDRRFRLAQGYEHGGDLKNAARVYRELYDADPQSELYFDAVRRTYAALGLTSELLPLVEKRAANRPNDYELRVAQADLLFRMGRRDEAIALWKRALEIGNYQDFVFAIVAQSQTDNHAFELAAESYRGARDRSDDRLLFADQLSFLYASLGRYDDATREYLAMLGAWPERLSVVKHAMAQLVTNPTGLAAATRVVEQAVNRNPDFEPNLELLSWLFDEAGNHAGALDVSKRLDVARGSRGSNVYAYADRALREGRVTDAIAALDYFQATYDHSNPLYSIALLSYARALEQRYRSEGSTESGAKALVQRYLDLAEREESSQVAAEALLHAARLQAEGLDAVDDAGETLAELIDAPHNASVLGDALILMGELRMREGDLSAAAFLFDRAAVVAMTSGNEDVDGFNLARLRRAELALYRGEYKAAVDSLTELTRNTSSAVTNDALDYLFLLQENIERNDAALGHYMAGKLLMIERKWGEAEERFDEAFKASPATALAGESILARSDAQCRSGSCVEAIDALIAYVGAQPDAIAADRALFTAADIADRRLNDAAHALELYTRLLAEYPRSQHVTRARARIRELRNG